MPRIRQIKQQAWAAAQQAYAAASDGRSLIADLADGFGIGVTADVDQIVQLVRQALAGQLKGKIRLPVDFIIDPSVDAKKE